MIASPNIRTREQIIEENRDLFSSPRATPTRIENVIRAQQHADEVMATVGPIPPCPAWCTDDPGHEYDSIDPSEDFAVRFHSLSQNPVAGVTITQEEINHSGRVTLRPVVITIEEESTGYVDGAELRLRAAEMLRLADRYDEIVAGGQA